MVNEKKLMFLASEVMISEEDKLDPVFLSIKLKLADNTGNLNNEGITAAFISDLVNRQEEFTALPFYADKKNLLARNYDNLGHMYNKLTKKFGTDQIGSFVDFYSETDNDGVVSLYATARVPKREYETCVRLVELYELQKFYVSVEIRYNPEYTFMKDGVLFIDANEDNALTGMALVSNPACADATALDMVAEVANDSDDIVAGCDELESERGETETMQKKKDNLNAEETELSIGEEEKAVANADAKDAIKDEEPKDTAIAEGDGAAESGGESDSGSDGNSGADEGSENAGEADAAADEGDGPTIDPSQEEKRANGEVLEHSVDTHESVDNSGWYGNKPVHVIEYHERIIETMEDAGALIAELDSKVAELEEIKSKYDAIIAEKEAKELAEKRDSAKAFAQKQGLNVEDTAVAEAIEKLDYAKIAELTMAEAKEDVKPEPAVQMITLASYVDMEIGDDNYGGLLGPRNKE